MKDVHGSRRLVTVVFEVADLDVSVRIYRDGFGLDLRVSGVDVLHEPRSEPWGTSARYRDPDGNVVELTQPAP